MLAHDAQFSDHLVALRLLEDLPTLQESNPVLLSISCLCPSLLHGSAYWKPVNAQ